MPRDPIAYLNDMLQSVQDLRELIDLPNIPNKVRDSSMVHLLQILGEAAKKIPLTWRAQAPLLPWKGMIGLRDIIVHEYFRLDVKLVEPLLIDLPLIEQELIRLQKAHS